MAGIVVLDEVTAGQIAAGEVVERPVSAVKELVENALDAGASRITVDLTDGGLAKIVVIDNGCGISPEDAETAFCRHATSKIKTAADLLRVHTLGFRGEALPSIAAVSKVELTTRTHDALTGVSVRISGGSPAVVSAAGCAPGTRVEISDIYFNTPVRRKSMKSPAVESGLCSELLSKIALTRPDVRFDFIVGGRRVFFTPGTGKLADAMVAVYGAGQTREMLPVSGAEDDLGLTGYVGKPSLSRSNRSHQTIIINGRYVRCPVVVAAVEKVYRDLLPSGRKPVVVLSLTVATDKLDVNVHPAKLEVRLLEERRVAALVTGALRSVLRGDAVIPDALVKKSDGYRRLPAGTDKPERVQLEFGLLDEETVSDVTGAVPRDAGVVSEDSPDTAGSVPGGVPAVPGAAEVAGDTH
ncbi:MAG: DNA mismatch repair endonuclease MutL, partial [Peptococcaceae bacterium]|nr:DNA mismatch repair endonuclease MutL [Peptococcaceae bacterium]